MDPRLKLVLTGDPGEVLTLLVRLKKPEVIPSHCRVITQFGDIISCRVERRHLLELYNSPDTFSVKAPRLIPAPLKEGAFEEDAPESASFPSRICDLPFTGKGVYFAAVDWGFDIAHKNLRYPDGTTRFKCIWDQNGIYDGNPYGYGCFYTEEEINEALRTDTPYQTLGLHPGRTDIMGNGMHGTHVIDIAAGTRAIGEGGVAPQTKLVGVELGSHYVNGSDMALGDSVHLVEAVHFIHSVTGDAPCVINMSLGSHGDSHTGKSLVELAFDHFLRENPGYALVQSVGNYYRSNCHIHRTLEQGQTFPIEWNIPHRNPAPNEVEIWYPGADRFAVRLIAPDGELVASVQSLEDIKISYRGDPIGYIFQRSNEPNTGLNHINIILDVSILTGWWIIEITGTKITNGSFHAYCERNDRSQARFSSRQSSPYTTTGSVCNGEHTITAGACNHRDHRKPVVAFSSSGPTLLGQAKPDLLAPGHKIQAARSAPSFAYNATNDLTVKSGSSMAAPHVSGSIALLFEKYLPQRLPVTTVKELLFRSLDPLPPHFSPEDLIRAGNGFLNTYRLLTENNQHMSAPSYKRPVRPVSYPEPEAVAQESTNGWEDHAPYVHPDGAPCENAPLETTLEGEWQSEGLLPALNAYMEEETLKPSSVFRHFHPRYSFRYEPYEEVFSCIGLPGKRLHRELRMGDLVLVRNVLANKTLQGVILEPELVNREKINGQSALFPKPGSYVKVYGNPAGKEKAITYIRVADPRYRLVDNVLILRKKMGDGRDVAPAHASEREALVEEEPPVLAVPALASRETVPAAETLYIAIDLGLRKECSRRKPKSFECAEWLKEDVEPKTGIFIPAGFTATPHIDLLIYLHGFKTGYVSRAGKDMAIDRYWNKKQMPQFAFRELLNESGRQFILVAPTLGPFSQPGTLTSDQGFSRFISQVMKAIAHYSRAYTGQKPPTLRSIILAAHSGGGIRMRAIAQLAGKNPYASLIRECWGFDCTYAKDDPSVWYQWAQSNPDKSLYLFSIAHTGTAEKANALKEKKPSLANIHTAPSRTGDHNNVPLVHMKERLSAVSINGSSVGPSIKPEVPPKPSQGGSARSPLRGSVGKGGQNYPDDILKVQTLLHHAGIPIPITGQVNNTGGDPTILGIFHYQRLKKLPYYDGKVDVNGSTIRSLLQSAGSFDVPKKDIPPQPPAPHIPPSPPVPPSPPAPASDPVVQAEWISHTYLHSRYPTPQAYKRVRDQVAGWGITSPADYIESALQQWNANSGIHAHFGRNFDGTPNSSYLNLKRLYVPEGITDPAAYFRENIVTATFFNKTTPAHRDLKAALDRAQAALMAAGHHYQFKSAWSFVPRTFNNNINKLSRHALGKAIDIDPANNPHITSKDEIRVINAVCSSLLPGGLGAESRPDVLMRASQHFRQTFNEAWIAQQTQPQLLAAIANRRKALNEYARTGFLNLPETLIKGLMNAGLSWGGSWPSAKDFMHFELPKKA